MWPSRSRPAAAAPSPPAALPSRGAADRHVEAAMAAPARQTAWSRPMTAACVTSQAVVWIDGYARGIYMHTRT